MEPSVETAVQGRDQELARSCEAGRPAALGVPLLSRMWLQMVTCQHTWQAGDTTRSAFPEAWLEHHLHWGLITQARD